MVKVMVTSHFFFEKTHVFDILHISYKQYIVNQVKNNVVYMHESLNYIPQLYFGIAYIFCKKNYTFRFHAVQTYLPNDCEL